jgi:hypothetical protein
MIGNESRIVADACQERGAQRVRAPQSKKVQACMGCYASLMYRLTNH